jgi:hypothetical protein
MSSILPKNFQSVLVTNMTTVSSIITPLISIGNLYSNSATIPNIRITGTTVLSGNTIIQTTTNNYTLTSGSLNVTGDIVLSSSEVMFTMTSIGVPTLNGRGDGSKIVLYPQTNITQGDYSIGIELGNTWFQVPTINNGYKFYQGTSANFVIATSGNVGINTTGPGYKLEINGNCKVTNELYVGNELGTSTIYMGGGASGDGNYNSSVIETRLYSSTESTEMLLFKGDDILNMFGPDRIRLRGGAIAFDTYSSGSLDRNAESIRMYINDTGNIGIGTTNPVQLLDINGSMVLSNFSSSRLLLGNATIGSARLNIRDLNRNLIEFQYFTNTVGNITCLTSGPGLLLNGGGGSSQLVLASTGNVGINSTSPNASLEINTSNTFGQLYLGNNTQNRKIILWDTSGNSHQYFGLGINDATLRYQISNQTDSHIFYAGANSTTSNELMRITGAGNVVILGSTSMTAMSASNIMGNSSTITNSVVTNITTVTLLATTSISTGRLSATNTTVTNAVNTALSSGTLNLTTGLTTSSLLATGVLTATNITSTNIVATTLSSGNALITTALTIPSLLATISISSGVLNATNTTVTNAVHTTLSSGTLNLTTGLTALNILATGVSNLNGNSNTIGNIFTTGGNVGINTTGPGYKLEINGNCKVTNELYLGNESGTGTIYMGGGASGDGNYNSSVIETRLYSSTESTEMLLFKGNDISSTSGPDRIRLRGGAIAFDTYSVATTDRNAESIRMYINDTGNIGIGTTNPVQLLDINGSMVLSNLSSSRLLLGNATIGSARLNIRDLNQNLIEFQYLTNTVGNITCLTSGSGLLLNGGGGSSQLVLASTGNVGINSTRPNASLEINTSNTFGQLYVGNNIQNRKIVLWDNTGNSHQYFGLGVNDATLRYQINGQSDSHIFYAGTNSTTSNELMRITGTGNVGIGATSPSYKLQVAGDIYAQGDIIAFSDSRLKTDIETIDNALDKVSNMRGVYYTNINTKERDTGVIAQEIAKILPEVVADKGEYLGVAYGNIVGVLIEAIKELRERIIKLEEC